MYVDASVIVAVLAGEADGDHFLRQLETSESAFTSVVTKVEAALAFGRETGDYKRSAELVGLFLAHLNVRVENVPSDIYEAVMEAAHRYGRGTGHRARLNFGDCFSYAMAKSAGVPLLYKGDDFSHTDLA